MIQTITFSLPSLFNIFSLLMLMFFIYSVMGVFIFSSLSNGEVLDEYNNFSNFGMAMIILLRVSTGEDWNIIMYDCSRVSDCLPGETCGSPAAYAYFVSFIVILSFIMLNLFILVIL